MLLYLCFVFVVVLFVRCWCVMSGVSCVLEYWVVNLIAHAYLFSTVGKNNGVFNF